MTKEKENETAKAMKDGYMTTDVFMDATSAAARTFGRQAGVRVIFEGDLAYTDGNTIVLPSLDKNKSMTRAQVMVARGYTDHEAGHVKHTDMKAYKKANEDAEARGDQVFPQVLNALEDIRIERLINSDYIGAKENLAAVHHATNEELIKNVIPTLSADDLKDWRKVGPLSIVVAGGIDAGYDDVVIDTLMAKSNEAVLGKLDKDIAEQAKTWVRLVDHCENTKDVIDLARRVCEDMAARAAGASAGGSSIPKPGSGMGRGRCKSGGSEEFKGGKDESGAPDGTTEASSEIGGGGVGASAGTTHTITADAYEKWAKTDKPISVNPSAKVFSDLTGRNGGQAYRPWSTSHDKVHTRHDKRGTYKTWSGEDYSYGHKLGDPEGDVIYRRALENSVGSMNQMRRKLERALMAKMQRDWRGGHEWGRIDSRRLVAAYNGEPAVFRLKEEAPSLDTAVSVLIDLSGSMAHSKAYLAMQSAICLAEVLAKVGVPFEVLGFNNRSGILDRESHLRRQADISSGKLWSRWECLDIYVFKDFDELFREAKRSMGFISHMAGGNNADGEALLVCHRRLMRRREARRIMLVMSDGYPAAQTSYSEQHLQKHLRNVVDYIEMTGVNLVGIGIMSDAVARFYPKYEVLNNIEDLPKSVLDNIARMLLGERFRVDNKDLLAADRATSKAMLRR